MNEYLSIVDVLVVPILFILFYVIAKGTQNRHI